MKQLRNDESRPLTARSVIASTLLGMEPPRLPARLLVRSGELFGISEGTTRVALSRMVAAGELITDDGAYRLTGRLLERQARLAESRAAHTRQWDGSWRTAVVTADRRPPAARAELRAVMRMLRMGELREGVWLRPDNLAARDLPDPVTTTCVWLAATPEGSPRALAAELWDLAAWSARAAALRASLRQLVGRLVAGDTDALAPGFVLSASVLRHFQADPLLPGALVPRGWPGRALRDEYDQYDRAFRTLWRDWFRSQPS